MISRRTSSDAPSPKAHAAPSGIGTPLSLAKCTMASDPELVRASQRLRYRVYHDELGLDTPDMNHAEKLDVERRDDAATFFVARYGDVVVGTLRAQFSRPPTFYAEDEFVLHAAAFTGGALAEGARFAVAPGERDDVASLMLFQAFRDECRERGISKLLSVAIVPGDREDREALAGLVRYMEARVGRTSELATPAPGYQLEPPTASELLRATEPSNLPPMTRLLANRRSVLASRPAYCVRFRTFNFLLVTNLESTRGEP